jgi:queuine tRNA-ribosyltransferase
MSEGLTFELMAQDGAARRGRLTTAHGSIETPAFMPVGTAGTVKAMTVEGVAATGAEIILGNTYHLMLRPGADIVAALGGLHEFSQWKGPILTDSGGFQVMSLSQLRKITEEGVRFRSHIDGREMMLSPEESIKIQHKLGADITMVFDECTPFPASHDVADKSMALSLRWAERSKQAFVSRPGHGLFGIVQGSVYEDLRHRSIAGLTEIGFDGYAVGGLAVGEGQEMMFQVLDVTMPVMPVERPRYLMGVGKPADIVGAVARGIDMFDCVMPTRSGRTGQGFTQRGVVNIRNARHQRDPRPLDESCACPTCKGYSRAYLHHLFKAGEVLGLMLLTQHNLQHYQNLMAGLRAAIAAGDLTTYRQQFEANQACGDIAPMA